MEQPNIDRAEEVIRMESLKASSERDIEVLNEQIQTLQGLQNDGFDGENIRIALTKLIHLRDEITS